MARTKRIFISDIHLGTGKAWDWYQKSNHDKYLLALLDKVRKDKTVKDLVLLGDIFDLWLCPYDQAPPTIKDILEHNAVVINALKRCVQSITNVFYVNGNHDMRVSSRDLKDIRWGRKRIRCIRRYHGGLLYAEHGHRFAMFNARDNMHDPTEGLPLGYFVTRLVSGSRDYESPAAMFSYVDDLLEAAFTTQTLSESLIEALAERLSLPDGVDTKVKMAGRPDISLREVQRRYSKLFDRWTEKFGYRYALKSIQGEMGSLGWFADRLCKKDGFRVVVFGHTHSAEVDVDEPWFFGDDRVYVNSGTWCGKRKRDGTLKKMPSFVEVNKLSGRFEIKLHEWKGKGFKLKGKTVRINT